MERDVIAVGPNAPLHQAAWILVEHGVPGLPVVDMSNRVLGVVNEQDLITRLGERPGRPWWRRCPDADDAAREYRRATFTTTIIKNRTSMGAARGASRATRSLRWSARPWKRS